MGKHLVPRLKKDGHDVYALVRPSTDKGKVGTKNYFVFDANVHLLGEYIKENAIDGVIHLASLYINQHNPGQIIDLVLSNIYLGTAVLEASVGAGVRWFLNTGTIWQNYNVRPFSKEYCPVNLYSASKQAFIDMARYYTETSDIRFCTLKLCDTYGPDDTRKKIYAQFEHIAKTGETLKMSPGEQKMDMVHIDKVIDNFSLLAEKLDRGEILDTEYVVTSGRQRTLRQMALDYERKHGVKLNIEWGGRAYRPREVMTPYIGQPLL